MQNIIYEFRPMSDPHWDSILLGCVLVGFRPDCPPCLNFIKIASERFLWSGLVLAVKNNPRTVSRLEIDESKRIFIAPHGASESEMIEFNMWRSAILLYSFTVFHILQRFETDTFRWATWRLSGQ